MCCITADNVWSTEARSNTPASAIRSVVLVCNAPPSHTRCHFPFSSYINSSGVAPVRSSLQLDLFQPYLLLAAQSANPANKLAGPARSVLSTQTQQAQGDPHGRFSQTSLSPVARNTDDFSFAYVQEYFLAHAPPTCSCWRRRQGRPGPIRFFSHHQEPLQDASRRGCAAAARQPTTTRRWCTRGPPRPTQGPTPSSSALQEPGCCRELRCHARGTEPILSAADRQYALRDLTA